MSPLKLLVPQYPCHTTYGASPYPGDIKLDLSVYDSKFGSGELSPYLTPQLASLKIETDGDKDDTAPSTLFVEVP